MFTIETVTTKKLVLELMRRLTEMKAHDSFMDSLWEIEDKLSYWGGQNNGTDIGGT